MLKRAMMAGLNAAGVDVEDLEVASVPVTRFIVRRPSSAGGVTIRLVHDDPQSVIIRFFDDRGLDITEDAQRKIERLFNREDFRRVFPGEIGDIGFAPRALEHYATALESTVDIARIRDAQFKVVIDYAFGSTSFAMPNVLAKLGLEVLAVNPFVSTAGLLRADLDEHALRVADLVRASGSHLGAVLDPDGERLRLIDDEGHVLTDNEALLALLSLLPGKIAGDKVALPVSATQLAGGIVAAHGTEVVVTKLSNPALMDAATEAGVGLRRQHRRRLHPARLPARLRRRRHLHQDARPAGPPRTSTVGGGGRAAPPPHGPRGGGDPVGAEGHRHAHAGRAEQGPRGRAGRRGEGPSRRRAGRWPCPIRRSR